jgi:hypothetical protein
MPLVLASMLLVAVTESIQMIPGFADESSPATASLVSIGSGTANSEIQQLKGTRQGRHVLLEWHAMREHGIVHYEIQRASSASRGWERVGRIAAFNGKLPQRYSFTDHNVPAEDVRYLLRIEGKNKEIMYSDIIVVPIDGMLRSFTVMPDPSGKVNRYVIAVNLAKQGTVGLDFSNATGRSIERIFGPAALGPGEHTFTIDASQHPAGAYAVRVHTPDGDYQRSLLLGR